MLLEATLRNRIEALKKQLFQLLSEEQFWWRDENMDKLYWKRIPEKLGVYVIIEEDCYIYVGKSENLRRRIRMHGRGNRKGDTFNNKLFKIRHISSKEDRKKFVRGRCSFKFSEVREVKNLASLEHFTISVLNPELND